MNIRSLISDTLIVNHLEILQMNVNYEFKGRHSNLGTLINRLEAYSTGVEDDTESYMIIDYFLMDESSLIVNTPLETLEPIAVKLPKVEQTGIGRTSDADIHSTAKNVLHIILRSVSEAAIDALLDEGVDQLLDRAGDAIRNLFNN